MIKSSNIEIICKKGKINIPVIHLKSSKKGPRLLITAGMHGDEVTGISIARALFKELDRKLLKGEVYALPVLNPPGFKKSSRFVESKQDMNRCFPGKKDGVLAERIAFEVINLIDRIKPDVILDLHNDWKNSVFYALIDKMPKGASEKIYKKTQEFGRKLGIPFVLDTEKIKGALSHNLLSKNIPSLTLELGESYMINKKNAGDGVKVISNILMEMKMIKNGRRFNQNPKIIKEKTLTYSNKPLPKNRGIIKFLVKPGDIIGKGREIVQIFQGKRIVERLYSKNKAIVLSCTDSKTAEPGKEIIALGVI